MNDAQQRKRLIWIVGAGGALILALLLLPALLPSGGDAPGDIVLRPDEAEPLAGDAPAATGAPVEDDGERGFSLDSGEVWSLIWRLGLVALIVGGAVLGLRWWGRKASSPRSVTGYLRVIDTMALSSGRTLHLVQLGNRVIVVGATAQQLSLLSELSESESAEVLSRSERREESGVAAFADELLKTFRRSDRTALPQRDIAIGSDA